MGTLMSTDSTSLTVMEVDLIGLADSANSVDRAMQEAYSAGRAQMFLEGGIGYPPISRIDGVEILTDRNDIDLGHL
jgi:hypothetical protein